MAAKRPVADELRAYREGFARVADELGWKALAREVRAGGPVEPAVRMLMRDLEGRKRYFNQRTRSIKDKATRLQAELESALASFRSLGGR